MVTVFISHSSKDKVIISQIDEYLSSLSIRSIIIGYSIEGKPPMEKIREGIDKSQALLLVWTSNVADIQSTRDIVNAEIGEAHHKRIPIFCMLKHGIDPPWFIPQITDYVRFYEHEIMGNLVRIRNQLIQMKKKEFLDDVILGALIIGGIILLLKMLGGKQKN